MTLTTDFSFQLGNAGFILNNNAVVYPTVDITEIKGLDAAPIRLTIRDREGTEGGYVDSEFEQARTIVLSGILYDDATNTEVTLDQLKAEWAPSKVPSALYYHMPKIGDRMLWVKPQGCRYDIDVLRRLGMCAVTFTAVAGDPRIYSAIETIRSMGVSDVLQTGFGFNLGFNFGFGGVTTNTGPAQIVNVGNRSTPVKFQMYGPFIFPHIINYTTGDEMAFDCVIGTTTDYLEVDTSTHTVRLNGTDNLRYTLRRPSWFDLEAGANFIGFRVEGGASIATHMDIHYRSAWR
jgi:hypothetical protein